MEHHTTNLNFWIEKANYIPTARLSDWPTNWYSTNNLRFFGSVSMVSAVHHDIESRVRLEALYKSIRTKLNDHASIHQLNSIKFKIGKAVIELI